MSTLRARPLDDVPLPATGAPASGTSRPVRGGGREAYALALVTVGLCSAIAWLLSGSFRPAHLLTIYLVGIVVISTRFGRGPSMLVATLSVVAFDVLFIPPALAMDVGDTGYVLTFAVMLVLALFISDRSQRIRLHAETARQRERWTAALYAMSRHLASTGPLEDVLDATVRHIADACGSHVVAWLPDAAGDLAPAAWSPGAVPGKDDQEAERVRRAFTRDAATGDQGFRTETPEAVYLPLVGSRQTVGVLVVRPERPAALAGAGRLDLVETFANQAALAIERASLLGEAQEARVRVETERLRSSLLSAVSHDLRTPLATITGAASSLLEGDDRFDPATRRELTEAIRDEADRLATLVTNLLEMTRLETGVRIRREWHPLEEIVGAALASLEPRLHDRPVSTDLPLDLPLVFLDDVLIQQVLVNLLDNAVKYTPAGSPIEISATLGEGEIRVAVADHGPGLAAGDLERVFEKFYRGAAAGGEGTGLGLAICQSIITAHGGRLWAENRAGGGTTFSFTLPVLAPPVVGSVDA